MAWDPSMFMLKGKLNMREEQWLAEIIVVSKIIVSLSDRCQSK